MPCARPRPLSLSSPLSLVLVLSLVLSPCPRPSPSNSPHLAPIPTLFFPNLYAMLSIAFIVDVFSGNDSAI